MCGIVYILKGRMGEPMNKDALEGLEKTFVEGQDKADNKPWEPASPDQVEQTQPSTHRWRCPDCGSVMESPEEGDLEFIKREHFREYHPNRAAG
jgi:predicted RNA-binding protein with PUA-like domain